MTAAPFSRRSVILLAGSIGVSLIGGLLWAVFGGEIQGTDSIQADSFSRSALGHHAFVELLRELDIDTLVSRNRSGSRAGKRALLLIAEPVVGSGLREGMLRDQVAEARTCLLVLPKWEGTVDKKQNGWVGSVYPVDDAMRDKPLTALGINARVRRLPDGAAPRWDADIAPRLIQPQLLASGDFVPLIASDAGTLLARVRTRYGEVFVLSDPDLLSNHGLSHPGNAIAMLTVLARVRASADQPVVVDETLHGFGREPSVYRALFDFPLLVATLHGVAIVVVLLWAGMGRFGKPEPARPPLGEGQEVLLANTADLLAAGGHAGPALVRYLNFASRETRDALHAPARLGGDELAAWLDRAAAARGITPSMTELRATTRSLDRRRRAGAKREVLLTARSIHRWKEDMIRGRQSDS
ncbi:MAG: hypothetical protein AAGD14_18965 [Planctomycetota bacterium]